MPLTDSDFNSFALGLAERFAERAIGLDTDNARLLNARPSDQVLSGFLTPSQPDRGDGTAASEDELAEDLPLDGPYEQTSIGLHWRVPRAALRGGVRLQAEVRLHVYVRRLPTRQEQTDQGVWRVPRSAAHTGNGSSQGAARASAQQADLVAVWTRESLPPFVVDTSRLDMGELRRRRRLIIPLRDAFREAVAGISQQDLYPGRRAFVVAKQAIADDSAFGRWRADLPRPTIPVDWRPVLDVRLSTVPTDPGCARVTMRVINRTAPVARGSLDFVDPNLYAVQLAVTVPQEAHCSTTFLELPQSFRYDRDMPAVGINTHVASAADAAAIVLTTNVVPIKAADRLEPRSIAGGEPRFDALESDPLPILRTILDGMRAYDTRQWAGTIARLSGNERTEASAARERFRQEITRFERGISLLTDRDYPKVARAFQLMNRVMHDAAAGRYTAWRLFQIVFIVSQLSTLAGREYPELCQDDDDDVDILWFAAGGGKTEAFLGLIVWQAFFDRLRGKTTGVASVVRFPLRLLTFQQLQRLGSALGAAELVRRREKLGGARFSIGYFVGRSTTPNTIDQDTHARYVASDPDPKLRRIFECPFCGAPTRLGYEASNRLVEHWCTRATDGCPGGNVRLPVYVVDADLFRFLPTVIVSTVDKLALFGQNQRFAQLFGRIRWICPRHGATFGGSNRALCPAADALGRGQEPAECGGEPLLLGPFHDPAPSLLIQDELHLLSEELGTFDSHYETGVIELMRSLGAKPWKIIAATATIERYDVHAWHLYLRRARQFPGPGPKAYESFYYEQNPEKIGRIFVGVIGVGRKHTPAVTRVLSLMYLELQAARDAAGRDLREAAARYGMRLLSKTDFDELVFNYELVLTYVLTRKGSDQVAEAIESRVKRELREVPSHGELLIDTFNGGVEEAAMSTAIQQIRTATSAGSPAERVRGIVTTNVIGHGVDVDRFNVIAFAGFPRLVAEYIQASARVGRRLPGLSLFVATPQSERDRSVFDRFAKFHEYLDRLVDPSAITRWPEPALRRTLPGLLAGYLMGVAASKLGRPIATVEQVQDNLATIHGEPLEMDAVTEWIERAYGANIAPSDRYRTQLAVTARNQYASIINRQRATGVRHHSLNTFLQTMRSLRDTDDPAFIRVDHDPDATILRRLIRG